MAHQKVLVIKVTRRPKDKKPKRTMYRSERANLLNKNYIRNNNKSTENKESDNKE